MIYIRSALFLFGQAISAILLTPVTILCFTLPSLMRARLIATWAHFNIWSLRVVCGISYRITGGDNIPDQPSVILANHQSSWETLAFQLIFPPLSFVMKKQLLWIPFFGWGLAANRSIAINRSKKISALDQLLDQGQILLQEGRWLVIYPEGTRQIQNGTNKFQVGGAYVATKCGVKVVPIAHNSGHLWRKNSFLRHPGIIDIVIGAPIETNGRQPREVNQEAENWIKRTLSELPQLNN